VLQNPIKNDRAGEGQQQFTRNRIPKVDTSSETPPLVGGRISKNVSGLGTNQNMIVDPDGAGKQE
jgi:hypothetical protein